MKKKILSLVLTACMVLSLLPALTLPASATNMVYYTVGETSIGNTATEPSASASGDGWTWTYTSGAGTLTLTDAYLKGTVNTDGHSYGAYLPDNTTIKLIGDSTAAGGTVSDDSKGSYGIYCKGALTIEDEDATGTGSLSAVGGKADSNVSDGIMANTSITISSGKVNAVGGSGLYSGGIQCGYTLDVSGTADVTALGGDATNATILGWSCGVYSNTVTLSGELTAVGGYAANGISAGIYSGTDSSPGTATISGGVVTAQGGKCANAAGSSYGMYAGGTFAMSGGLLSASSGTATTSSALSKAPTMTGVVSLTGSYSDKFAVYGDSTTYMSANILTSTLDLSNNKTNSEWSNSTNSNGWKWDYAEAGSTLTLKNMIIVGTDTIESDTGSFGIQGEGNISIVYEGVNVVCGGTSESGDSCGIEVEETGTEGFSLSGDGTLIALGRQVSGSSCGIRFLTESGTGGFNVSGGKVIALGGDAGESYAPFSCGLEANNLTITGGDVTAVGGAAAGTGSLSAGAVAGAGISVSSGQLVAVGGHASGTGSVSVGACSYGTTIFSGDANIVAAGDGYGIGTYLASKTAVDFQLGTSAADTVTVTAVGGTAAANSDATTAISNKFISCDGGTYTTAGSAVRFRLVDSVIAVAHDGSTFTYYTSFADGWNDAVGDSNTAKTTVKLLANWTATDGSFGKGIGFGSGYASSTGFILVPEGKTITLDLNGHNIDRHLSSAKDSGYVIDNKKGTLKIKDASTDTVTSQGMITGGYNSNSSLSVGGILNDTGGTLTLQGGRITGNKAISWGGGVRNAGTFNMTGGAISGNIACYGNNSDGGAGGVFINGSSFTMTGGEISGNYTCNSTYGGGAYVYGGGTMTVGGTAKITGNVSDATFNSTDGTASGGVTDNVYLPATKTIKCLTGDDALTTGASIGVTTKNAPTDSHPVAVTYNNSADYSRYFHSDYSDCHVFNDAASTSSQIVKLGYGVIEVAHDGSNFTIYGDFSTGWNNAVGDSNKSTTKVRLLADWTATTDATCGTSFGTGVGFGDGTASGAGFILVPKEKHITLDLNGHTIDRGLTAAQTDGEVICIDSANDCERYTVFTLTDSAAESPSGAGNGTTGCITGGYNSGNGGGIYMAGSSVKCTIKGGCISGNRTAGNGGGIVTHGTTNGDFLITGGKIIGNSAANGGGIYCTMCCDGISNCIIQGNTATTCGGGIYSDYRFIYLGGATVVSGNAHGANAVTSTTGGATIGEGGAADNLYLTSDTTVCCPTDADVLTTGASIGVTTQTVPVAGAPVAVTSGNSVDYSGYFHSDNSSYYIKNTESSGDQIIELCAGAVYTVTFDANGHGTAPDALTNVTSGSKISAPTAPTASGYTFGGWYKDADCTTAWDFASDTVTTATTLYAKWTASTYTVTFNANGHGTAPDAITNVTSGSKITAPTEPTASGYTFGGWYKDADCTNQWNFASDTVTAATTLYAKWTANGGNSGSGSSGSSGSTTTTTTTTGKAEPVIVDGTEHDIGTKTTTDTTTTVTVDNDKLQEQLESASESVVVPITSKTDTTVAQLVVKNVEDMAKKDMTLTVDIGDVQYNMPTTAVDTAALMKDLGATDASKVPVNVTIKNLEQSAVTVKNGELMLNPVEFTVTATYGGKTAEVERFSQYVQRVIEIPTGTDSSKITTALRVEDGEHVPTYVYQKDSKWYARINSLTNSTYTLIYNEQSFADAAGKWYEKTADEMASRCVIFGRTNGSFDGGASITRAEFAAIVVRALGLPESGTSSFSDVASSAWCYGAVSAASEYGIVCGYTDGSFRPNANITRQEAMAMVARAAKVAELNGVTTADLSKFNDAATVGAWAREYVTYNVANGLIVGNNGYLKPNADISRAETATVILRLLQKAELVDVRSAS